MLHRYFQVLLLSHSHIPGNPPLKLVVSVCMLSQIKLVWDFLRMHEMHQIVAIWIGKIIWWEFGIAYHVLTTVQVLLIQWSLESGGGYVFEKKKLCSRLPLFSFSSYSTRFPEFVIISYENPSFFGKRDTFSSIFLSSLFVEKAKVLRKKLVLGCFVLTRDMSRVCVYVVVGLTKFFLELFPLFHFPTFPFFAAE